MSGARRGMGIETSGYLNIREERCLLVLFTVFLSSSTFKCSGVCSPFTRIEIRFSPRPMTPIMFLPVIQINVGIFIISRLRRSTL